MQVSLNEVSKITNSVTKSNIEKPTELKQDTSNYAKKEEAPVDAKLYNAMYGVKEAKKGVDEAAYRKAMEEHLLKWGTDDQLRQFYGNDNLKEAIKQSQEAQKAEEAKPSEPVQTEAKKGVDEAAYRKAMEEHLLKWGTDDQLRQFYGNDNLKEAIKQSQEAQKAEE